MAARSFVEFLRNEAGISTAHRLTKYTFILGCMALSQRMEDGLGFGVAGGIVLISDLAPQLLGKTKLEDRQTEAEMVESTSYALQTNVGERNSTVNTLEYFAKGEY